MTKVVESMADEVDVVAYEKTNYKTAVVYKTKDDAWYGVTMNSAYQMVERVQKLVGLETRAKWQFDSYYNMERPVVVYHANQISKIRSKVAELKYKTVRDDERFFVFEMPEAVKQEEVVRWLNSEQMRKEKLRRYFLPKSDEVFRLTRELVASIMMLKMKGSVGAKDAVIGLLMRYAMEINEQASVWGSKIERDRTKAKQEIMWRMERCNFVLSALADRRMVEDAQLIRVGSCFLGIRNLIDGTK